MHLRHVAAAEVFQTLRQRQIELFEPCRFQRQAHLADMAAAPCVAFDPGLARAGPDHPGFHVDPVIGAQVPVFAVDREGHIAFQQNEDCQRGADREVGGQVGHLDPAGDMHLQTVGEFLQREVAAQDRTFRPRCLLPCAVISGLPGQPVDFSDQNRSVASVHSPIPRQRDFRDLSKTIRDRQKAAHIRVSYTFHEI